MSDSKVSNLRRISLLRGTVVQICSLLRYYAAYRGITLADVSGQRIGFIFESQEIQKENPVLE